MTSPDSSNPLIPIIASAVLTNETQAVVLSELADHLPGLTGKERSEMTRDSHTSLAQSLELRKLLQRETQKAAN